ncbi:polysaccharide deacetylase family protein [Ornithinibacillus halophilus]|uniref:Polysaccharide deacetylase n=1 Tax=Ornithinibacillus halophilus TaxID=930117 RepID=A0A1M5KKM5_9BACI|nr:polysaccharide deacetylase family protein [Ornithinibacillus halophilus]SHG53306.1 Polysaccharide deacetylase [Ornithinibacillus halophilus]
MDERGFFIISLDFELFWGVLDVFKKEEYEQHVLGARKVVPQLLDLFHRYEIHATWAIVGMMAFNQVEDVERHVPLEKPSYKNKKLSPYRMELLRHLGNDLLFAPPLLQQIQKTPDQEIATHTFSHYYTLEEGQTKNQFQHDLEHACKFGVEEMTSVVFPRNQINEEYLQVCWELGMTAYRGNEDTWIYRLKSNERRRWGKRALRLLDGYFNLFGHQTYRLREVSDGRPVNVKSSRFLKPYSKRLSWLERLRLRRIKKDMTYAAKHGEVYHLWWHPHNFGVNQKENLAFLKEILNHYVYLQEKYGFQSMTMKEAASIALAREGE